MTLPPSVKEDVELILEVYFTVRAQAKTITPEAAQAFTSSIFIEHCKHRTEHRPAIGLERHDNPLSSSGKQSPPVKDSNAGTSPAARPRDRGGAPTLSWNEKLSMKQINWLWSHGFSKADIEKMSAKEAYDTIGKG